MRGSRERSDRGEESDGKTTNECDRDDVNGAWMKRKHAESVETPVALNLWHGDKTAGIDGEETRPSVG